MPACLLLLLHLVAPAVAAEPAAGVPFGFWGLNGYLTPDGLADLKQRFGLRVVQTATSRPDHAVQHLLPLARAAGVSVTLRMTGGHDQYTTDGDFDLARWQAKLAAWEGVDLQPFIDDGTLLGHMLLDDIHTFEGRGPTAAELDEMAQTSHAMFPGLMTFVRERATGLPVPEGGRYLHLDACVNQYKHKLGDVRRYAEDERKQAESLGLGIIMGLNINDGGDGSSRRQGWRGRGFHPMSADEIRAYGSVIATTPGVGMVLLWEYDGEERWPDGSIGADYFDQPALQAALSELSALVAAQPAQGWVGPPSPVRCPRVYLGRPGIASLPGLDWPEDGAPRGLDPGLVDLLSDKLGCTLPVVGADLDGPPTELRFSLLEQGQADLSIFQFSVTPDREQRVDFTQAYTADGVAVIVPVDSPAQRIEDLATARIIASAHTTAAAWVQEALPRATLVTDLSISQQIKDCFDQDRCDALAGDASALDQGVLSDLRVRVLPDGPYTREPWAIAVAEGDTALRQRLDAALRAAEADGSLPALRQRWGMPAP